MANKVAWLSCVIVLTLLYESVNAHFPLPSPLGWFQSKNPDRNWQHTNAFEYTTQVKGTAYTTHVKVTENQPGNANERNFKRDYEVDLCRYTDAHGADKWSNVRLTWYSDHHSIPVHLRSKKFADVVWVGANVGNAIDIKDNGDATPARGRGTIIVTMINNILTELRVHKGTCHNVAGFTCQDGTSKYLEVFHRMWQGKGAWYTSFGYNPPALQAAQLAQAKQRVLTKTLDDLYKLADWTGPFSDYRAWRRQFRARITADLGEDWKDKDLTLQELMMGYVTKMGHDDNICQGYVRMIQILDGDAILHVDLEAIKTINENLRHGPYT